MCALANNFFIRVSICILLLVFTIGAQADSQPGWLTDEVYKSVVPGAIYAGPLTGDPPVAAIYGTGEKVGYAFETSTIVEVLGFTGASFSIVVGLHVNGDISGVSIVEHTEPILNYGDNIDQLENYVVQYNGINYADRVQLTSDGQNGEIDGITGATISARAFNYAIVQSARSVAQSLGLKSGERSKAMVDALHFKPLGWLELIQANAIQAFTIQAKMGTEPNSGNQEENPTEFFVALVTPVSIGRNLLSRGQYKNFVSPKSHSDLIIVLMSNGPYSIVGTNVFDTGIFDRVRITQNDQSYTLARQKDLYRYVPFLIAEGAPDFSEMAMFRIPVESGIDVLQPWEVVISVRDKDTSDNTGVEQRFSYQVPSRFVLPATAPRNVDHEKSPMEIAWQAQTTNLIVLGLALSLLTLLIIFMGPLTRRPWLYNIARTSFLLFTLIWIGWVVGAQLSVINPIAWAQAFSVGKGLDTILLDPLLVVLTAYVLLSFIAWGRGIFCGWLCPFGALQELLASLVRRIRLPQITLSHSLHQKLWPVKYVVLAGIVGSALHASSTLGVAAEVEPFKTAISLKFDRAWPFVLYAIGLLAIGLFIERAYCRFICPLGAIMAIGGKLRLYNPLKRREECGSPCQLCTRRCPIQAITPTGQINMDECFYCLDCQVIYYDEHSCPPLINKRKQNMQTITLTYQPKP